MIVKFTRVPPEHVLAEMCDFTDANSKKLNKTMLICGAIGTLVMGVMLPKLSGIILIPVIMLMPVCPAMLGFGLAMLLIRKNKREQLKHFKVDSEWSILLTQDNSYRLRLVEGYKVGFKDKLSPLYHDDAEFHFKANAKDYLESYTEIVPLD